MARYLRSQAANAGGPEDRRRGGGPYAAVIPNPKAKLLDQPRKLSGPGPRGDAAAPLFNPHRAIVLRLDQAFKKSRGFGAIKEAEAHTRQSFRTRKLSCW